MSEEKYAGGYPSELHTHKLKELLKGYRDLASSYESFIREINAEQSCEYNTSKFDREWDRLEVLEEELDENE